MAYPFCVLNAMLVYHVPLPSAITVVAVCALDAIQAKYNVGVCVALTTVMARVAAWEQTLTVSAPYQIRHPVSGVN